ncbi:glucose 1-dehydrogenase A [Nannizzia gypsea CBS 118893]|uniref:Glucose 1-dehydrogenase A n=1 Tax=Arthroderma gypseum (strain ATCC MYA-4604 / CBS 118893) TaxID=535722 RepID=E5R283_ARTGP|nr:glucose 1-dehydrogenase A [Nannizzia gypsea CBS 118893]EFQ96973.1 glucose 1-dehydrogenase A [Nannizzia gypsea CBS 118893]
MAIYSGKNAVIIGGSHGIGLEVAKALVSQGARVVVSGRRAEPVEAAAKELNELAVGAAIVVQSDVTCMKSHAELEGFVKEHLAADGAATIDFLFINAAYANLVPFKSVTEADFDKHFNNNTRGPFFIAQRLVPYIRPGGSIVFTASVSIGTGYPGMAAYSASKAAVYSLVQTLAAELASGGNGKEGIRVNAVSPGFVDTPTMGIIGATKEDREAFAKIGAQTSPMGRIAKPTEIAKAVLFLGFDATYTTGIEFVADGGSRHLSIQLEGH